MGAFAAGAIVIVRFPFSDLTQAKFRPAVVLAGAGRGDSVLSQITSQPYAGPRAIAIESADFVRGSLRRTSYARQGKLFTAHTSLVTGQIGILAPGKFAEIREAVVQLIQKGC